jgi:mRNA interferase MazF
MDMGVKLNEVWLVDLEPTKGFEISKIRPCAVISPNEMNGKIKTVLVAPMTSTIRLFPFRVNTNFQGKSGQIALDQIQCIDQSRLVKKLGTLSDVESICVSSTLIEIFQQ